MTFNYKRIIPLALTASVIFTGCGSLQAVSTSASESSSAVTAEADSSSAQAGTEASVSIKTSSADTASTEAIPAEAASAEATSTEAASTEAAAKENSEAYSEAFSDRDLSGEYDAGSAVSIALNGTTASADSDGVSVSGSNVTITEAGTYILSGSLSGSIIVNVSKEDKVQLVLDGVTIDSETFAAIYVVQADKVFITLAEGSDNTLSNGGSFVQVDDNNVDAVIFSKDDITLNGTGTLTITSPAGHGIVGKDEVTITGGVYEITAAEHAIRANDSIAIADGTFTLNAGEDGLHAENSDDDTLGNIYIADGDFTINASDDAIHATALLQIEGGSFDITASEGLEATRILINDGTIGISASDDGINAAYKSSAYTPTIEINDGELTIVMASGDTDAIDSNGNLVISGGTIDITGQSAFDYDGTAEYNGGTIIVNGETINTITNQMMGGGMQGGMQGGMNGGMQGGMGGEMPEGGMPEGGMPEGGMPGGMRGGMGGGMRGGF